MKPFNLEQALAGKPVVTLEGTKIIHIHHMPMVGGWAKVVAVDENGIVRLYDEQGAAIPMADRSLGLFMAPETVTVWLNIYKGDEAYGLRCCLFNETEAQALAHKMPKDFIKTISITIEI